MLGWSAEAVFVGMLGVVHLMLLTSSLLCGLVHDNGHLQSKDVVARSSWPRHPGVQVLLCIRHLMGANWRLLVRAWPTQRGAPLPLPAIMDLLANLYNEETPTSLPVRPAVLPWCWTRAEQGSRWPPVPRIWALRQPPLQC